MGEHTYVLWVGCRSDTTYGTVMHFPPKSSSSPQAVLLVAEMLQFSIFDIFGLPSFRRG